MSSARGKQSQARLSYPQNIPDESDDAPSFSLLSKEKCQRIHGAVLQVLEEVGIRTTTAPARKLLTDSGCTQTGQDLVRIPGRIVENAINSAPKNLTIYDREGTEALLLEGKSTHFGVGITGIHFHDPQNGERRDPVIEDVALVCRVADALPNIDLVATPLIVRPADDMPQEIVTQRVFQAMVSNTTKPLVVLAEDATILQDVLSMAELVAGGPEALRQRPFIVPICAVVSPLILNPETLDKLIILADRGIPVRCVPAPISGGTGPVTLAGNVVVALAESLAGLVVSQLRKPGAPFIMGSIPMILDMKTVNVGKGAPETSLMGMATVEMAHYYGLPSHGGGPFGNSMGADQQMALEQMMTAYSNVLAGVNLAPFVGFIEAGQCFSLEAVIMGDEIIGMVRRIMRGMPVDDETLALDLIHDIGPGGNFLDTQHTFRHFRKEQWQPSLLCRTTFNSWVNQGSKSMGDRVREKLQRIIQTHRPKPLSDQVTAGMSEIIERRRQTLSAV